MSLRPISATQKWMNLVGKFSKGDCGENELRSTSASAKGPTRADYPSSNHVSNAVSNFVSNSTKNVTNYLTSDAKTAFNQLRQAFTKAPILQHFDPKQYIHIKIDTFGQTIGQVLSQLTNDLCQWHPLVYFLQKWFPLKYNTKLTMVSFWSLLRDSKPGGTT